MTHNIYDSAIAYANKNGFTILSNTVVGEHQVNMHIPEMKVAFLFSDNKERVKAVQAAYPDHKVFGFIAA